ncbi:MAG: pre-toxin TG domain-containing protein [Caldilineaceae bacterium]|nr:pre-toxin TG domain-containing protein [Caldilineaceae bacterium]
MNFQIRRTRSSISITLTLTLCFALLLNSGVVAYAQDDSIGETNNECPESLLLRGKELIEQVPDIYTQFPGRSSAENDVSEDGWFSPKLPDWLEMQNWSWPTLGSKSSEDEGEPAHDSTVKVPSLEVSRESTLNPQDWSSGWIEKAETLLKSHGFEDTDGDGALNWPDDSPLVGGQNLDIVVVATETSGVVIGFVPVAGDAVDVIAIVIAKDPITGECLSKTDQLLFALSLLLVIPVSAGTLKLIGKQIGRSEVDLPKVWGALQGTLDELEFETHTWFKRLDNSFSWTFRNAKNLKKFNRVAPKYRKYRVILGSGATSSSKLAMELGYRTKRFSKSNYRDSLITFTGRNKDEVSGLEAHHILPQGLEQKFTESGFETIHDPRFLVWVDPTEHHGWGKKYNQAWESFFEENPRPSKLEILEEAQAMAEDYGYDVLFKTSSWNPFWQVRWPFGF